MKPTFKQTLLPLAVALPCLLSSCQDLDYGYTSDGIAYEKNFTTKYGAIPSDKSWDLSSYTSYSSSETRADEPAPASIASNGSLIEGQHFSYKEYYQVPDELLSWLNETLVEGRDNRFLGSSFVMRLPDNDFAIVPIFQGASSIMSELEVKVNGYDMTKVWTKSQYIEVKDKNGKKGGKEWEPVGYFDGWANYNQVEVGDRQINCVLDADGNITSYSTGGGSFSLHPASTIGVQALRTKPIFFDNSKFANSRDYLYLSLHNIAKNQSLVQGAYKYQPSTSKWLLSGWATNDDGSLKTTMWDAQNEWTTIGDRITSIHENGYMLAINVPADVRPYGDQLPKLTDKDPSQVLIIGVEDANGAGSDHDVNDVAFLVIGYPNVPEIIPTEEVIKKRYMCEDLGATDDFDFNDIVVDATQTMKYKFMQSGSGNRNEFQPGIVEGIYMVPDESTKVQYARISHVCGTLPFQVKIGDVLFPKVTDPTNDYMTRCDLAQSLTWTGSSSSKPSGFDEHYTRAQNGVHPIGWNPNEERIIGGWNPHDNNIKIYVDWGQRDHKGVNINQEIDKNASNNSPDNKWIDFVDGTYNVAAFPKPGEVPYIIATDQDVPWMKERQDIPEAWVTEKSPRSREGSFAPVGSNVMLYNYGHDHSEAIIWAGAIYGQAKKNGVVMQKGSTYHEALLDVIGGTGIDTIYVGKGYRILNVYTEPIADGKFSLAYPDANGQNWTAIDLDDDADYYYVNNDTNNRDVNGYNKTSVMLCPHQVEKIRTNGFVVVSQQNGLKIRKVTMDRMRQTASNSGGWQEGNYITLNSPTAYGKIMTTDRARERESSDGKIAFKKAYYPWSVGSYTETVNNTTCTVPAYTSTVTLIAQADPGYKLDKWQNIPSDVNAKYDNNKVTFEILKDKKYEEITCTFKASTNPKLALSKEADKNIELAIPSSGYTVALTSSSNAPLVIEGIDNRFIEVTANGKNLLIKPLAVVGNTEFTVRQEETDNYAASETITIKVSVTERYAVGIHIQVAAYNQTNYTDNNAPGAATFTTEGTFFRKNGDNYEAIADKAVTVNNGNLYYVIPGTVVTMSIPNNQNYYLKEANSFKDNKRECTIDHDNYTPYVKYWEKKDPQLTISPATITLDYNTPLTTFTVSSNSTAKVNRDNYKYDTEVNIWGGDETTGTGTLTVRAQEQNGTFTPRFYQAATDEYKAAEKTLTVIVKDYVNAVYGGYRIPITNNQIPCSKIKDALHLGDSNTKNIKVLVHRKDTGLDTKASIYSSTSKDNWNKVIREEEKWTNYARGNDDYNSVNFGMQPRSICFIISATDFKNYLWDWNSKIVIDCNYKGFDEVYVTLTDDSPFK